MGTRQLVRFPLFRCCVRCASRPTMSPRVVSLCSSKGTCTTTNVPLTHTRPTKRKKNTAVKISTGGSIFLREQGRQYIIRFALPPRTNLPLNSSLRYRSAAFHPSSVTCPPSVAWKSILIRSLTVYSKVRRLLRFRSGKVPQTLCPSGSGVVGHPSQAPAVAVRPQFALLPRQDGGNSSDLMSLPVRAKKGPRFNYMLTKPSLALLLLYPSPSSFITAHVKKRLQRANALLL